ncbi:SPT3 Dosage dependent suppressor of Ty-induced promoter mutations-like protein [Mortierella alpina]|uniref:SPT3 Dosage dependent suppressor of Ty-induced promoter mutations-like protein n=1 Tax=Mortierella alpina TaxID=64518 RepID=A0A9P6M3Y7_MORAP|nr:SPT3 Dosage dependent suppressor of Ty-induced promoter mutations-like protein [Mortierella alpina]
MPPHSSSNLLQALGQSDLAAFDATFLHQHEESTIRLGDLKKAQLATPQWNDSLLFNKPTTSHRLNVKTHVFKKELQEYVPTQIEDRLRIETIIYVELSIVDHNNNLVSIYDYARLPKDLFFSQPDKVMSPEEMATKRIVDIAAVLQCPSNNWQEEKEACLRCARRMSTKMDQTESRIMHMLPELHRTENGDALISFRSGVANIQFKINCYCGHKKEKEGFVIRFDSKSDVSIASHVTLPLMFYHQNKNRVASRALAAAAKAQGKADQQPSDAATRNIVKTVSTKTKRESRSKPGHSPIGQQRQHQIPSPPNSLLDSPLEWNSSPEMDDFIDSSDTPFTVPSPPPPDPLISLFPESMQDQQQNQQSTLALISHMTPNSGPVRGGTLVTIHGSGFTVGEVMYVCFGENLVPIIPQRDHMLECVTPASNKAETVPVFAVNAVESTVAQATFTYIDDNEKELIKLALQRVLSVSARMDGPLDNVLTRANEFTMWSELLEGGLDGSSSAMTSFANAEKLVLESLQLLDTPLAKNCEGLSIVNNTGHTMLHLAVVLQFETLVRDLLVRGVDVTVQDKNGHSAMDWARHSNSQRMIDILSGVAGSTAAEAKAMTTSGSAIVVGTKSLFAAEDDVVDQGLLSSVSPGSRPTATDQPGFDHGEGSIGHSTGIQIDRNRTTSVKGPLGLSSHTDPHMDFEWEGFGQGPGKAVAQDNDEDQLVGEVAPQYGRHLPLTTDQHQHQYGQTLSAIPSTTDFETAVKVNTPVLGGEAPAPQRRLPIAAVGQAGVIQSLLEQNIPISNPAFATCPIGGSSETLEQPVGGLDRTTPIGQDAVATEGCTTAVERKEMQASSGVPGSGSSQGIQASGRIGGLDVRLPVAEVGTSIVDQQQRSLETSARIAGERYSLLTADESEVVVDDVEEEVADSNEGGSQNSATTQAVVQSSRNDVESEPLLFLGGLPVTLSPRPNRTLGTAVSNPQDRSAGRKNSEQDLNPASSSSENDVE